MISRAAVLLTLMFLAAWILQPPSVLAYLDPGTGSIAYQVLVGGALALAATVRLYWRKIIGFVQSRRARKRS